MKYIIIGLVSLLLSGCSSQNSEYKPSPRNFPYGWYRPPRQIPTPTDEWKYAEAKEEEAELRIHLSLRLDEDGKLGTDTVFLKRKQNSDNSGHLGFSMRGVNLDFEDGWMNLSKNTTFKYATSTSIVYKISWSCSSSCSNKNYDVSTEIVIPYIEKGSDKSGELEYSWKWEMIKDPNQTNEPTSTNAGNPVDTQSEAALF